MKCPIKMREFPADGQSLECDPECAWCVDRDTKKGRIKVCAIALIAHSGREPNKCWTNVMEEK